MSEEINNLSENIEQIHITSVFKIEEKKTTITIEEKGFELNGNFRESDLYKEKTKELKVFQDDQAHQWKIYAKDGNSNVWKLKNNKNNTEFTVGDVVKNKYEKLSIIGGIRHYYNKYYIFLMNKDHEMFQTLVKCIKKVGIANTNDATLAIQKFEKYPVKFEKLVHKTVNRKIDQDISDTDEETSEEVVEQKSKKEVKKRKKKEKKEDKNKKRKVRSPHEKMTKDSKDLISPHVDYNQQFSQPSYQNPYPHQEIDFQNFPIENIPTNNLHSPYHHYNQHYSQPSYQNPYPPSIGYPIFDRNEPTFNYQENSFDRFPPFKNYLYNRMPFYNNTQFFSYIPNNFK